MENFIMEAEKTRVSFKVPEINRSVFVDNEVPLFNSTSIANKRLLLAVMQHDLIGVINALENKADINSTNDELQTSLHFVAENGNINLGVHLLSYNGIKLDLMNRYGFTPLWIASWYNKYEMANLLLQYGAAPNIKCRFMNTALHAAVSNRNFSVVRLLVQHGAKVNEENCFGETPLEIAIHLMDMNLIIFLLENGARREKNEFTYLSQLVISATPKKFTKVLKILLKYNVNINALNELNETNILHTAAMRGNIEIIQSIIDHGGNPYHIDADYQCPLVTAFIFQNYRAAVILADEINNNESKKSKLYSKLKTRSSKTRRAVAYICF